LDYVVERTKAYAKEHQNRWLAGKEEEKKDILSNGTHNLVGTDERRRLHAEILAAIANRSGLNLGKATSGEKKPIVFTTVGPMGVGKSTLLAQFNEYINNDRVYDSEHLQAAFCKYRDAKDQVLVSDFQLYKDMIPEFKDHTDFAFIRPEASGLDQAVNLWANELKVNVLLEHLGDGGFNDKFLKDYKEKGYEIVVLGVTITPEINKERLAQRNGFLNENIKYDELLRTIKGFSDRYQSLSELADMSVLVQSGRNGYKVVHASEQGILVSDPSQDWTDFIGYKHLSDFLSGNNNFPAPGI